MLHRCEASRISIRLKRCCIGNRGAAGASYLPSSSIYPPLTEKIGPPLIILVSDFQHLLGENPQIHPRRFAVFCPIQKKPKILGLEFVIALDYIGLQVVVAGRFPFCFVFLVSESVQFFVSFPSADRQFR